MRNAFTVSDSSDNSIVIAVSVADKPSNSATSHVVPLFVEYAYPHSVPPVCATVTLAVAKYFPSGAVYVR